MRRRSAFFTITAWLALFCVGSADVSHGWAAPSVAGIDKMGKTAAPTAVVKPVAGKQRGGNPAAAPAMYHYNSKGKADPFKPFMETDPEVIKRKSAELAKKKVKALSKVINPLQKEDIGKFLLVGITGDAKRRTAIVEDKTAKRHYPLSLGTFIGQNGGRVTAILPDKVIVEERVNSDQKNGRNKKEINRIEMLLHREIDK